MDIYYMSDSIHYGSMRNPLYRDYEKFPYGTLENPLNTPPKLGSNPQQIKRSNNTAQGKSKGGKASKDSCPFCKEQKKRPLGAYMRKRGQRIHCESISEDAEECEGNRINEEEEEEEECSAGSGSEQNGSPSNGELTPHGGHYRHHHSYTHGRESVTGVKTGGRYSRQESQDSDSK